MPHIKIESHVTRFGEIMKSLTKFFSGHFYEIGQIFIAVNERIIHLVTLRRTKNNLANFWSHWKGQKIREKLRKCISTCSS